MNGRAYDYNLGRFLSVDPFIQATGNSQSINPYSYIMNNPLAGTDPSGYTAECNDDGVCDIGSIKTEDIESIQITKDGDTVVNTADGSSYKVETVNGKDVQGSLKGVYNALKNGIENIGAPGSADITHGSNGGSTGVAAAGMLAGKKAIELGAQAAANQSPYLQVIEGGAKASKSGATTSAAGVLGRLFGVIGGLWPSTMADGTVGSFVDQLSKAEQKIRDEAKRNGQITLFRVVEPPELKDIIETRIFRMVDSSTDKQFAITPEAALYYRDGVVSKLVDNNTPLSIVSATISYELYSSLKMIHLDFTPDRSRAVSVSREMLGAFNADVHRHGGISVLGTKMSEK